MQVWIDITNSPHVLFFRPLIRLLQADGHEVEVTTREYAQTLELLELHGIDHHVIGPRHGGSGVVGKARALAARLPALRRFARPHGFDVALTHGSHELTLAARSLGIPSATAHDYEFATLQHQLGLRAATRVVFPEAVPAKRLARLGARPPKLVRYPGIKEEYYLADFEPDPAVIEGIDPAKVLAVVRTPPDVSLYHRHGNPLFAGVLERLGRDESVHAVVLPRTAEQRESIRSLGLPSLACPRPRGGRAEPRRARRPHRLGGRDDEPRGRGPRNACLHDVHRPARRGRRTADPVRSPAPALLAGRARCTQARECRRARAARPTAPARPPPRRRLAP